MCFYESGEPMQRVVLILLIMSLSAVGVRAQDVSGGQFWVRVFEDRNGSGIRDAGEPLVTRGVSADLIDSSGTVIRSALLDSEQFASQGLIGFQSLPPGEYTIVVTSVDLTATTPTQFSVTLTADAMPTVVEFGGQRIAPVAATVEPAADSEQRELLRIGIAGVAALIVIGGMISLGLLIYALVLRPNAIHQADQDVTPNRITSTGTHRAVKPETPEV